MTTPTPLVVVPDAPVRPGSRADRMSHPRATTVLRTVAERHGVCLHPIPMRRIDRTTGQAEVF